MVVPLIVLVPTVFLVLGLALKLAEYKHRLGLSDNEVSKLKSDVLELNKSVADLKAEYSKVISERETCDAEEIAELNLAHTKEKEDILLNCMEEIAKKKSEISDLVAQHSELVARLNAENAGKVTKLEKWIEQAKSYKPTPPNFEGFV